MTGLPRGATVFVTGATGMLGSHVAAQLRERGYRVRALYRPGADTSFLRALGCELVVGDVTTSDPAPLAESMGGCGALVHAAAVAYTRLSWPAVRAINVWGTERMLRAASRAAVPRVLHVSSVAVHGDPGDGADESSPLATPLVARELYARSKREAEEVVRALAVRLGSSVAILRPAAVYGERDRLFTPILLEAFRRPLQPILGDGRSPIPAVYAGNVADAALALIGATGLVGDAPASSSPGGTADVFEVGADWPVTPRDLYGGLARALGVPFRPVPIPRPLVQVGAHVGEALGLRVPGAEELPLPRSARLAMGPNPFGSARLRAELGWSPPFALADAIARTAAWAARDPAMLARAGRPVRKS